MNKVLQNCQSKKQSVDKSSLQFLVDEYHRDWGNSYREEDRWWSAKELTWEKAIERAWDSILPHEKMHRHQWRVGKKLPEGLKIALADGKQPEDFRDFQSLYDWVKFVVDRVKGLRVTTAYDVARRLGAWLRLEPSVVYLHAGTAAGAKKFGIEGEFAPLNVFPTEIQKLGATHAENFLCIYKDRLSYIVL